ncbi:MAG: hypothetical protein ACYDEO_13965 [Aggregatilineales bacterium]
MPGNVNNQSNDNSRPVAREALQDKAFIDRVSERVYQLLLADLRREQERRGGRK